MPLDFTKKFYLIRFLVRPYWNINEYVCVPNSWLVLKSANYTGCLVYPKEDPAKTRLRAKNNEKPGLGWTLFEVKVEYQSDDYTDADTWGAMDRSSGDERAITGIYAPDQNEGLTNNVYYEVTMKHNNASNRNSSSNTETRDGQTFRKQLTIADKTTLSALNNPVANSSKRKSISIDNDLISPAVEYWKARLSKSSTERNSNDQSTDEVIPATQALINLLNKRSQLSVTIESKKHQPPHQKQHGLGLSERSTKAKCIGRKSHPSNGTKNHPSAVLKSASSANLPRPLSQHSRSHQFPPAYEDFLSQNLGKNKAASSTKLSFDFNELRQNIENQLSAEQNYSNITNQLCQMMYEHTNESKLPTTSRKHLQPNSCPNDVIFKPITGGKFNQFPRASNQFQTPAGLHNHVRHVSHTQRSLSCESTATSDINQGPSFRDTRQNIPPTKQPIQNLHQNQILYLPELQDPRNQILFLKQATEVNSTDQRPPVQAITQNTSPAPQATLATTNQSHQPYDFSYNDQFGVDCRNAELSTLSKQQMFQRGPVTIIATNQKVNPQNPSKSSIYSPCKWSHGRQLPLVSPSHSSQDPHVVYPDITMAERHSPMIVDYSDEVMITDKIPINKLPGENSSEESSCIETATKDVSLANQNSSNVVNMLESSMAEVRQTMINGFKSLISQINVTLRSATNLEKDDNDILILDDSKKCYDPSNNKRRLKNKLVLPPEYNPKNSRWTLKHQKASTGIIEVLPRSRVYIDARNLALCKRKARNCKKLARMLLTEIFFGNALRVCSLPKEKRTRASNAIQEKPELDEHAMTIMLKFVEAYAKQNGWVVDDKKTILKSLYKKMYTLRSYTTNTD